MLPGERSQRRAAWLFLAPALILIGVFFFLPVAAGLALSVTDFDLYAIGHAAHTFPADFHESLEFPGSPPFDELCEGTCPLIHVMIHEKAARRSTPTQ